MNKVGFIGLGIMGKAMAANLINAGFDLTVWNRSTDKADPLIALGAKKALTPREVATTCALTFAMLADPAAAEAVCFGPDGILEGIGSGRGYVDMSTVDVTTSQKIAEAVASKGGRFLEAPVSGSKKPAEDGTLIILTAGDLSLYEEAMPAFEIMGKKVLYLGAVGNGATLKLVVNMIMGGMMTIFSEGLALGRKAGLDAVDILEVIDAGAMSNPMFQIKGRMIGKGDYTVAFPLKHMQKDLRLAVLLGDLLNQPLFSAAAANEWFKKAKEQKCGDEDFSAVYKVV